jgi:Arc/MetJ-type ribon-helix-helix transcriptional regulator
MHGKVTSFAKRRTLLVTFRLTAAEYDDLREACAAGDWKSISEFARAAVIQRLQARSSRRLSLDEGLQTVCGALEEIDAALIGASGLIRRVLHSEQTEVLR